MPIRLMDVKIHEWKPDSLQKIERALDSELKYTDEKKGTACKTIRFEQETGYPKQDARFLDLSIRAICTTEGNRDVDIEKDLITKAIIQKKDAVNAAIHGHVFSSGNVRFYERDRNKLNLIIIPASVGFVTLLFILTFFLRRMRDKQKREHIISELQKKREVSQKKIQTLPMTMPNIDPFANDKQRLLQLDPTVVGNVSHTMGSSKQFTNEQYVSRKTNHVPPLTTTNDQRTFNRTTKQNDVDDNEDVPPPIPPKDNRPPYYKREEENPFASQRPVKTSHERMYVPFENETRFSPTHGQQIDMVALQEKQPRVIVRSIRDDENFSPFYHQQTNFDDSAPTFVSIPVQIEHSTSHQRFSSSPYHSDPYYPHINS